ncbi:apolipoprotein D-like [Penaeus monodon]|uniref:apolipoprotein D-like n=1 Tax=Penaeus monodon TaxID=6687 RepID=UPI0018A7558E|nr:apolipoprotein D-like [Penaeus monodon]XP_037794595.1 apolipoprotein D-like [Penaeus monodon]XP_037794596.1 apolipoprotein D-like [Penaeus monodon]
MAVLLVFLAILSLFVGAVRVQGFMPVPPDDGPCPVFPVVEKFDLHAYLGRWYEIERFFNPFQDGSCVTADYALFPNGSVSVLNSDVQEGELNTIAGVATLSDDPSAGQLFVEFPFTAGFDGNSMGRNKPNYNVVATDYKNYAVVYTCEYFGPELKFEFSWILARRPQIPNSFLTDLKHWLQLVNINAKRYMPTVQTNCPNRAVS